MNQTKFLTQLSVKAIAEIGERNGSKLNRICKYIKSHLLADQCEIRRLHMSTVLKCLMRAARRGILISDNNRYRIVSREDSACPPKSSLRRKAGHAKKRTAFRGKSVRHAKSSRQYENAVHNAALRSPDMIMSLPRMSDASKIRRKRARSPSTSAASSDDESDDDVESRNGQTENEDSTMSERSCRRKRRRSCRPKRRRSCRRKPMCRKPKPMCRKRKRSRCPRGYRKVKPACRTASRTDVEKRSRSVSSTSSSAGRSEKVKKEVPENPEGFIDDAE